MEAVGEVTIEMLKNSTFDIEIPSFEKWNPDTGRPRHWFKMDTCWYIDPRIRSLGPQGGYLWCVILANYSRSRSQLSCNSIATLSKVSGIHAKALANLIVKLAKLQLCRVTIKPLRIEEKRIEEKRGEGTEVRIPDPPKTKARRASAPPATLPEIFSRDWVRSQLNGGWEEAKLIYPDAEWIDKELSKMAVWLNANRRKSPKNHSGWTRFIMSWLSRGWEDYRKTLPSNKPGASRVPIDHDALWANES